MGSARHISPWKWVTSALYSVALDRDRSFFPCYEATDQMRPNSTIRMSSGRQFVDACPCAPHQYCQCPRSLSQICTLLPILLKKLQRNSLLTQFCQNDPCLLNHLSHERRSQNTAGQTPGASMSWLEHCACPDPGFPRLCSHPVLPCRDFCHPGTRMVLSLLPPLPQLAIRSFTSYFECHRLKYTQWMRCYFIFVNLFALL